MPMEKQMSEFQEQAMSMVTSSVNFRWSRNARLDYYDNEAIAIEENRPCTTLVERRSDLLYCISQLVDEGCMSTKAYQHARKGILQLKKECRHMNEYREPEHANTKGGEKRLKSSKEKAKRKERLCRRCN
eukprot:TRINITY_DN7536_c0_g1_i5.p2 TRINITY_DN7536_c0_g1~~TRINITY_DN7536_c0_g1_i5.p2  ORF type:complete len:130 (+),score=16.48 TRINITY_DN7536_c0_g1_i5:630-1019(+)